MIYSFFFNSKKKKKLGSTASKISDLSELWTLTAYWKFLIYVYFMKQFKEYVKMATLKKTKDKWRQTRQFNNFVGLTLNPGGKRQKKLGEGPLIHKQHHRGLSHIYYYILASGFQANEIERKINYF